MRPALLALLSALAVAWYLPALLTRLTAHGASARLGLTAWLTGMASVLALLLVALQFLIRAAVDGWPRLAEAVCRSVAGGIVRPGGVPERDLRTRAGAGHAGRRAGASRAGLAIRPQRAAGSAAHPGACRDRPPDRPQAAGRWCRAGPGAGPGRRGRGARRGAPRRLLRAWPPGHDRAQQRSPGRAGFGSAHGRAGPRAGSPGRPPPLADLPRPRAEGQLPGRAAVHAGAR